MVHRYATQGQQVKNCTDCKHADWKRNAAGNLHPSGDGMCRYEYKVTPLPACMYWVGYSSSPPNPSGGAINRRHELSEHCVYFTRAD
jgi:hypothetical protein